MKHEYDLSANVIAVINCKVILTNLISVLNFVSSRIVVYANGDVVESKAIGVNTSNIVKYQLQKAMTVTKTFFAQLSQN